MSVKKQFACAVNKQEAHTDVLLVPLHANHAVKPRSCWPRCL